MVTTRLVGFVSIARKQLDANQERANYFVFEDRTDSKQLERGIKYIFVTGLPGMYILCCVCRAIVSISVLCKRFQPNCVIAWVKEEEGAGTPDR